MRIQVNSLLLEVIQYSIFFIWAWREYECSSGFDEHEMGWKEVLESSDQNRNWKFDNLWVHWWELERQFKSILVGHFTLRWSKVYRRPAKNWSSVWWKYWEITPYPKNYQIIQRIPQIILNQLNSLPVRQQQYESSRSKIKAPYYQIWNECHLVGLNTDF